MERKMVKCMTARYLLDIQSRVPRDIDRRGLSECTLAEGSSAVVEGELEQSRLRYRQ
jgi:hypothetical protein